MFASNSRCIVLFSSLLFILHLGFQMRICLVIQFTDFCKVLFIRPQHTPLISSSDGSWFIIYQSRRFWMVFGQWIWNALRRQLFINFCTFLMLVVVVLEVSAPWHKTFKNLMLKVLTWCYVTVLLSSRCFLTSRTFF